MLIQARPGMGCFSHILLLRSFLKHISAKKTDKLAPKIHNLVRLAEIAELLFGPEDVDTLAEMNEFNLEGRYPITFVSAPTKTESQAYMKKAKGIFEWLTQKL